MARITEDYPGPGKLFEVFDPSIDCITPAQGGACYRRWRGSATPEDLIVIHEMRRDLGANDEHLNAIARLVSEMVVAEHG